jgi:hypothetical protein
VIALFKDEARSQAVREILDHIDDALERLAALKEGL